LNSSSCGSLTQVHPPLLPQPTPPPFRSPLRAGSSYQHIASRSATTSHTLPRSQQIPRRRPEAGSSLFIPKPKELSMCSHTRIKVEQPVSNIAPYCNIYHLRSSLVPKEPKLEFGRENENGSPGPESFVSWMVEAQCVRVDAFIRVKEGLEGLRNESFAALDRLLARRNDVSVARLRLLHHSCACGVGSRLVQRKS
jgi:hypothetical protein